VTGFRHFAGEVVADDVVRGNATPVQALGAVLFGG